MTTVKEIGRYPAPGHYIDRCVCGKVLAQCRCMGPKTERVVSPCNHQPVTYTTVAPTTTEEVAAADANGFGVKRGMK